MKTVREVVAALSEKYAGRTKLVKGSGGKDYTYIGWDDAVRELDAVFGPDGWSAVPVSFEGYPQMGIYLASVKLTGRALDEDTGVVVEFDRPGFGRGVARASKAEFEATRNPVSSDLGTHDTAAATAGSDALSRATKLLGDRFGLYLYDKDQNGSAQASGGFNRPAANGNGFGGSPFGNRPAPAADGSAFKYKNPDAPASNGQLGVLKKLGMSEEDTAGLTMAQAGALIDQLNGSKASGF